jgi:hypothetical protein
MEAIDSRERVMPPSSLYLKGRETGSRAPSTIAIKINEADFSKQAIRKLRAPLSPWVLCCPCGWQVLLQTVRSDPTRACW